MRSLFSLFAACLLAGCLVGCPSEAPTSTQSAPVEAPAEAPPPAEPSNCEVNNFLCVGTYALCSEAQCVEVDEVPDWSTAGDVQTANCSCIVKTGPTLSDVNKMNGSCDPPTDNIPPGFTGLWSTYGMEGRIVDTVLECPSGRYTQCFPMACIVSDSDPTVAICNCPLTETSEPYMTQAGGCDVDNCKTQILNGVGLPIQKSISCPGLNAPTTDL